MLTQALEELYVLVCVKSLNPRLDLYTLTAEIKLTSHFLISTDVKLSNLDMLNESSILIDSITKILHRWVEDVEVTLHTDTVDRHTCILHLLNHVEDTLALSLVECVIVIIEEESLRVCLTSELECLCDELITTEFVEV